MWKTIHQETRFEHATSWSSVFYHNHKTGDFTLLSFLKKMGQPRPLLSFSFGLFKQTSIQFLQQINAKKCPSSIRCCDLNPRPYKHESSPITTRPGLSHFFPHVFVPFQIGMTSLSFYSVRHHCKSIDQNCYKKTCRSTICRGWKSFTILPHSLCMHNCLDVCVFVLMFACMCLWIFVCKCVLIHNNTYACLYVCL